MAGYTRKCKHCVSVCGIVQKGDGSQWTEPADFPTPNKAGGDIVRKERWLMQRFFHFNGHTVISQESQS